MRERERESARATDQTEFARAQALELFLPPPASASNSNSSERHEEQQVEPRRASVHLPTRFGFCSKLNCPPHREHSGPQTNQGPKPENGDDGRDKHLRRSARRAAKEIKLNAPITSTDPTESRPVDSSGPPFGRRRLSRRTDQT